MLNSKVIYELKRIAHLVRIDGKNSETRTIIEEAISRIEDCSDDFISSFEEVDKTDAGEDGVFAWFVVSDTSELGPFFYFENVVKCLEGLYRGGEATIEKRNVVTTRSNIYFSYFDFPRARGVVNRIIRDIEYVVESGEIKGRAKIQNRDRSVILLPLGGHRYHGCSKWAFWEVEGNVRRMV